MEHLRGDGHVDREAPVEIVNLRLRVWVSSGHASPSLVAPSGDPLPVSLSQAWFDAADPHPMAGYDRQCLPVGDVLSSPVIIVQLDAKTLVSPGAPISDSRRSAW